MEEPETGPEPDKKKRTQNLKVLWGILLVAGIIVLALVAAILLRSTTRAYPSAVKSGYILLIIGTILSVVGARGIVAGGKGLPFSAVGQLRARCRGLGGDLLVLLQTGAFMGRRRLVPTEDYDHHRYGLFKTALDAVSLGMGLEPQVLVVADIAQANAFNPLFGGRRVVAVTPALLSADLTQAEVEAIMAVAAARQVYLKWWVTGLPGETPPGLEGIPAGIDLDAKGKDLWQVSRQGRDMQYDCMTLMEEDILAARTTGQPAALASAIRKVRSLLADSPAQLVVYMFNSAVPVLGEYWVIQSEVFVSPPLAKGKGNMQRQAVYDLLIDFRIENLEALEAGTRKPHETIRAAKTVVKPEGWR